METLRRALQDNREVFVSVVNKTNEDQETAKANPVNTEVVGKTVKFADK